MTKDEEQENLLITLISKIEDAELKEEYLKKLEETMMKNADCDDPLDKSMIKNFSFKSNNPQRSGLSQWHGDTAVCHEPMH